VEPDKERILSSGIRVFKGEELSPDDPKGIIVGLGLAANLGVDVGDTVVLVANTQSGGVNAAEVRVRGLFATMSKAYDDVALRVPLDVGQQLLRVDSAHVWALLLDRTERARPMVGYLRERFAGEGLVFTEWIELADFHVKAVALFAKQAGVIRGIIAVIIVLSIFNTMIMSVLEHPDGVRPDAPRDPAPVPGRGRDARRSAGFSGLRSVPRRPGSSPTSASRCRRRPGSPGASTPR